MKTITKKTMDRIIAAEEEHGEPFHLILRGYAADGESIYSTSQILGFPYPTFRVLDAVTDPGIEWPARNRSCAFRECDRATGKIPETARRNMAKARSLRWPGEQLDLFSESAHK